MRFGNRGSFRTSMMYVLKKKEFKKTLLSNLGLNAIDVEEVLNMNKNVLNFPRHRLINNCLICEKYNVNVKPVTDFYYCLTLTDYKLEHRINILKDIGVQELNSSLVTKMIYFLRNRVSSFKAETNIPAEQNIARNIFGRLDDEASNDISQLELLSDKLTMRQYYEACLLHCKTRIFDLPYLDDNVLLHRYMKFKSISMIAETLKVLRNDLDYDEKMIKKCPYVITASADNIRSLLDGFTDICGMPISIFLRKYPHMLFQDADNMKRLLMSFKRYQIPDEYVRKFVKIFTMGNDTFIERIERLKRHPDLHVWYMYPRILELLVHETMTEDRVRYLHIMNRVKWARPNTVLLKKTELDKFIQNSSSIVLSKKALKHILIKELGVDKSDLLARHQYWKTVGFVDIEEMIKYLKRHFTTNEICQNIHIILYARSKVEKILADLKQQYSQNTQYSFTNSQYLALCLYMLEKDTHFTGDGIWNNGHNAKQQFSHPLKDESVAESINDSTNSTKSTNDDLNSKYIDDIDHVNLNNKNETSNTTKLHYV